jgi:hypothetical protein
MKKEKKKIPAVRQSGLLGKPLKRSIAASLRIPVIRGPARLPRLLPEVDEGRQDLPLLNVGREEELLVEMDRVTCDRDLSERLLRAAGWDLQEATDLFVEQAAVYRPSKVN